MLKQYFGVAATLWIVIRGIRAVMVPAAQRTKIGLNVLATFCENQSIEPRFISMIACGQSRSIYSSAG